MRSQWKFLEGYTCLVQLTSFSIILWKGKRVYFYPVPRKNDLTTFIYYFAQCTNEEGFVPPTALVDHLSDIDIETFSSDVLETTLTAFQKRFCLELFNFSK